MTQTSEEGIRVAGRTETVREAFAGRGGLFARARDHFFPYGYIFNAWRREHPSQPRVLRLLLLPIVRLGLLCGFRNIDYALVNGPRYRVHIGERCSTVNTVFNVVSGHVSVGDDTLFSHDCQLLTGVHRFAGGKRASLVPGNAIQEVPTQGRDISIGSGCFFGAGAMVIGPVTIGDNVIVAAGAVVTHDVPDGSFVAGIPARVLGPS